MCVSMIMLGPQPLDIDLSPRSSRPPPLFVFWVVSEMAGIVDSVRRATRHVPKAPSPCGGPFARSTVSSTYRSRAVAALNATSARILESVDVHQVRSDLFVLVCWSSRKLLLYWLHSGVYGVGIVGLAERSTSDAVGRPQGPRRCHPPP
jgi:hypothetical protein